MDAHFTSELFFTATQVIAKSNLPDGIPTKPQNQKIPSPNQLNSSTKIKEVGTKATTGEGDGKIIELILSLIKSASTMLAALGSQLWHWITNEKKEVEIEMNDFSRDNNISSTSTLESANTLNTPTLEPVAPSNNIANNSLPTASGHDPDDDYELPSSGRYIPRPLEADTLFYEVPLYFPHA
jgi:hypothetical protein